MRLTTKIALIALLELLVADAKERYNRHLDEVLRQAARIAIRRRKLTPRQKQRLQLVADGKWSVARLTEADPKLTVIVRSYEACARVEIYHQRFGKNPLQDLGRKELVEAHMLPVEVADQVLVDHFQQFDSQIIELWATYDPERWTFTELVLHIHKRGMESFSWEQIEEILLADGDGLGDRVLAALKPRFPELCGRLVAKLAEWDDANRRWRERKRPRPRRVKGETGRSIIERYLRGALKVRTVSSECGVSTGFVWKHPTFRKLRKVMVRTGLQANKAIALTDKLESTLGENDQTLEQLRAEQEAEAKLDEIRFRIATRSTATGRKAFKRL